MLNLTAFNLRTLGDTLTLITVAKRGGISDIVELEALVKMAIEQNRPRDRRTRVQISHENAVRQQRLEKDRMPKLRCSVCAQYMQLLPVNDKPSTQIGGEYQSCGLCMNPDCMNVEYFVETVKEKREVL